MFNAREKSSQSQNSHILALRDDNLQKYTEGINLKFIITRRGK
jgi:hypothetical protein